MRCPICGASSNVRETRGGLRRRQCPAGHRFVTEETVVRILLTPEQRREEAKQIARMPGTVQQVAAAVGRAYSTVAAYRRQHGGKEKGR